jgi:hypothetical protein
LISSGTAPGMLSSPIGLGIRAYHWYPLPGLTHKVSG